MLYTLRHHVQDVVHHCRTQLQIIMRFNSLLGDSPRHSLGLSTFELPRKKVPKPSLQQRNNSSKEEKPHAPHRSPESHPRTLSHGSSIEPVVDQMFQVLWNWTMVKPAATRSRQRSAGSCGLPCTFVFASSNDTCIDTYLNEQQSQVDCGALQRNNVSSQRQ